MILKNILVTVFLKNNGKTYFKFCSNSFEQIKKIPFTLLTRIIIIIIVLCLFLTLARLRRNENEFKKWYSTLFFEFTVYSQNIINEVHVPKSWQDLYHIKFILVTKKSLLLLVI